MIPESARMCAVPAPRVAHDGVEIGVLRRPAQVLANPLRRCIQHGGIAGTPWRRAPRQRFAGDPLHRGNHVLHRRRTLGANVVAGGRSALRKSCKRPNVGIRQIGDMNVVAQTGSVGCRIVLSEDLDRTASRRRLERARDDVNLRRMILAKLALGIGAGGVEVPQPDRCNPVGAFEVRQRVLDGQFGLAVGVDRRRRMGLAERRR